MDEVTRKAALKKINAMKSIVAYPDELKDDLLIEQYYGDLQILPDQYFHNMLNIRLLSQKNEISQLREHIVDGNDWKDHINHVAITNAYYLNNRNAIGKEKKF